MGGHLDIADVFIALRVNDPYFAVALPCVLAAVAYVDQFGIRFVNDAVGPGLKLDRIEKLESVALKHSDHSVVTACQKQLIQVWNKQRALRLFESRYAPQPFPGFQVNHFDRAIL